jgi:hypothetical protein
MFRNSIFLAVLLVLGAPHAAFAQRNGHSPPPRPTSIERQAQSRRELERGGRSWENGYDERSTAAMANLPRVRAALARMWQVFGMTPQDAKAVAAQYRINDNDLVRPKALYGKSDDEIAAMLQAALTSKHYQLANMLLIEYQRKRMYHTDERPYDLAH